MTRTPEITHKIMASIKSKNTKPEILLRKALWHRGYRYRINNRKLKGKPDIVFSKVSIAVFCDGDFWHGHNWALRGMHSLEEEFERYTDYWREKISKNIARDQIVTKTLEKDGWLVIRFWESDILRDVEKCADIIVSAYVKRLIK